jgi:hypothetical protein
LDNVDHTVRFTYRDRSFVIEPVYRENPEWRWEAMVSELDATDHHVISGPGMLDYGQSPRDSITRAMEQILDSVDHDTTAI